MIVEVAGRALAMDAVGEIALLSFYGKAGGAGAGADVVGELDMHWPVCSGHVAACEFGTPGTVQGVFSVPVVEVSGGASVDVTVSDLQTADAVVEASGAAFGSAEELDVNIDISEFERVTAKPNHRLGSSGAGASYVTMVRAHPTHAVTEYDSQGPTNSDVVAALPIAWLDAMVSNSGSSTLFVMFFDTTSVPANGTLPMRQPIQVPNGGQTYIDVGDPGADGLSGRPTLNGLCWAASTTATTLTVDTTSSIWVTARTYTLGT